MIFNRVDPNLDEINTLPRPKLAPGMAFQPRFQGKKYISSDRNFYIAWSKASAKNLKKEIELEREETRVHEKQLAERKLKWSTNLRVHIFFDNLLKELRQK